MRGLLLVFVLATTVQAQSLGDVARAERDRRAREGRKTSRVITNDQLPSREPLPLGAEAMQVRPEDGRTRGNPQAPVRIVMFADFGCDYCRQEQPVLEALLEKYRGRVSLTYRDFPLGEATALAAEAGHCAAEQERFWPFHDRLLGAREALDRARLLRAAQAVGLNRPQFDSCLDSRRYREAVERDRADGERAGVAGTPTFVVNGFLIRGAAPLEVFDALIEALLARAKQGDR